MIDFAAFADELTKIAAKRGSRALYSPGVVAHEAGHAVVHKKPGATHVRILMPAALNTYATGRLGSQMFGAPGMDAAELGAVSALGNAPILADEAVSSIIGLRHLKTDKKMTKKDWKRTALQLAAINSSYLSSPLLDIATLGAAKAGVHPLIQLGMQLAAKPALGKAWSALGMRIKGPKVTAKRAKEIVQATAPGTPVFATKHPIPGGSLYVPPAGKGAVPQEYVTQSYGGMMSKKDLDTLRRKGGVLLAPLDAKKTAKGILNPFSGAPNGTKFKRIT